MKSWVECGQDPALFWRLTLHEVELVIEAAVNRLDREQRLALEIAWQTANLTGISFNSPKKFPSLSRFLPRKKGRARHSVEALKAIALTINAMNGGEVRKK